MTYEFDVRDRQARLSGSGAKSRRERYVEHLASVPLFSACSKRDLRHVARHSRDLRAPAGTELTHEGRGGDDFFVILDGAARVSRNGRKVATLTEGQWFGELALLDTGVRTATVTAATDMDLAVVEQRWFLDFCDETPGFARKILEGVAARLREVDARSVQ